MKNLVNYNEDMIMNLLNVIFYKVLLKTDLAVGIF